jgi:hypothetical protein
MSIETDELRASLKLFVGSVVKGVIAFVLIIGGALWWAYTLFAMPILPRYLQFDAPPAELGPVLLFVGIGFVYVQAFWAFHRMRMDQKAMVTQRDRADEHRDKLAAELSAARQLASRAATGAPFVSVGGDTDRFRSAHNITDGSVTLLHAEGDLSDSSVTDSIVYSGPELPREYRAPRPDLRSDCMAVARELQEFLAERSKVRAPDPEPVITRPRKLTDADMEIMAARHKEYSDAASKISDDTRAIYIDRFRLRVAGIDEELRNAGIDDRSSAMTWGSTNLAVVADIPRRLQARCLLLPEPPPT